MKWLIVDISTAPLANAAEFLDPADSDKRKAPANYSKPEAIAEWRRKDYEADLAKCGLDMDLSRVTGIGTHDGTATVTLCRDELQECVALSALSSRLRRQPLVITFNGLGFDIPLLMRRARYLGVDFPVLSTDRYRSSVVDLCELLCDRNPARRRSLQFYAKRLGWSDLTKALQGADEARVHETGQWQELAASIGHDLEATRRLAAWLGQIPAHESVSAEAEMVGF